jgi:hypothetical protein
MTLGRWLDMRGIQISSYPAKARNAVARAKRPLDIGKGLVSAAAAACRVCGSILGCGSCSLALAAAGAAATTTDSV